MAKRAKKTNVISGRVDEKTYKKFITFITKKDWTITDGLEEAIFLLVEKK